MGQVIMITVTPERRSLRTTLNKAHLLNHLEGTIQQRRTTIDKERNAVSNPAKKHSKMIESVERWTRRLGKAHLLNHLRGGTLPILQAVYAKCYECSGGDSDVCTVTACPLQPYSQFCPQERNDKK